MKLILERDSNSGKKRVGWRENKGDLEAGTAEYLEEKTPVEIIEERKQRLCTSRMDTRLRTPVPRRRGVDGWERKQLRIELNDEEARVDLTRNAPDEKSREPTIEKTNCVILKKI